MFSSFGDTLTQVKHPRNFSASATRSRSRQNESSISSVWVGAGGNLLCTGVRAELVPRGVEGSFDLETNDDKWYPAFDGEIDRGTTTSQRDGVQSLQRISDVGRFHWFTDEKGVANFLQRPPSRQKAAFPTHLADVVPYTAFQVCCVAITGIGRLAFESGTPSSELGELGSTCNCSRL